MNSDRDPARRSVGRYELVRQIGQGAMATVYLARQLDLDRAVALKELDRVGPGEPGVFASRFLHEARLAGSLSHANIVTVYEYFEHNGRPYIAMEYAEGGSLRGHLEGLSQSQIIGVLEGLLAALSHAEARGIVHRDIKPENVLVTADGHIKIADFGIAKAYSLIHGVLTAPGTIVGTPMYMAPEQATGKPISIATDLYAVGIVAFEMLFGYVPFDSGESPLAIVWQHVNDPVPDPHALRPDLDHRLCSWLVQMLAKDPADRASSAAAALDALEEIALALLGNRWRREAPLLPHAARIPDAGQPADAGATRDAGHGTMAQRAPPDQVELEGRARSDRPIGDAPERKARSPVMVLALMVVAMLLAAGGGYLLFDRDAASPGPARSERVKADDVVANTFAAGFANAFARLEQIRRSLRVKLAAAKTAQRQAIQARAIASAYRAAAVAVKRLRPASDQRDAAKLVRSKLLGTAKAYGALADAAVAHRSKEYNARRRLVNTHEAAVLRAADQIKVAPKAPG